MMILLGTVLILQLLTRDVKAVLSAHLFINALIFKQLINQTCLVRADQSYWNKDVIARALAVTCTQEVISKMEAKHQA